MTKKKKGEDVTPAAGSARKAAASAAKAPRAMVIERPPKTRPSASSKASGRKSATNWANLGPALQAAAPKLEPKTRSSGPTNFAALGKSIARGPTGGTAGAAAAMRASRGLPSQEELAAAREAATEEADAQAEELFGAAAEMAITTPAELWEQGLRDIQRVYGEILRSGVAPAVAEAMQADVVNLVRVWRDEPLPGEEK